MQIKLSKFLTKWMPRFLLGCLMSISNKVRWLKDVDDQRCELEMWALGGTYIRIAICFKPLHCLSIVVWNNFIKNERKYLHNIRNVFYNDKIFFVSVCFVSNHAPLFVKYKICKNLFCDILSAFWYKRMCIF